MIFFFILILFAFSLSVRADLRLAKLVRSVEGVSGYYRSEAYGWVALSFLLNVSALLFILVGSVGVMLLTLGVMLVYSFMVNGLIARSLAAGLSPSAPTPDEES